MAHFYKFGETCTFKDLLQNAVMVLVCPFTCTTGLVVASAAIHAILMDYLVDFSFISLLFDKLLNPRILSLIRDNGNLRLRMVFGGWSMGATLTIVIILCAHGQQDGRLGHIARALSDGLISVICELDLHCILSFSGTGRPTFAQIRSLDSIT